MLFELQSQNPTSHVIVNTYIASVVFHSEEVWKCIVVCDMLNQIELCNNRIATLGSMNMAPHVWKFVTEYYRVTRGQAINAVCVIAGGFPIKYCEECGRMGKRVQANYKYGSLEVYYCNYHVKKLKITAERIW